MADTSYWILHFSGKTDAATYRGIHSNEYIVLHEEYDGRTKAEIEKYAREEECAGDYELSSVTEIEDTDCRGFDGGLPFGYTLLKV